MIQIQEAINMINHAIDLIATIVDEDDRNYLLSDLESTRERLEHFELYEEIEKLTEE